MPQLDFSTYLGQFSWLILSFFSLYLLVQFLFFPKIEKVINSRTDLIKSNLALADEAIKKVKAMKIDIEAQLKETNEQAHAMNLEAEKKTKLLIDKKIVENENITSKILKEEASKLALLRKEELEKNGANLIAELKKEILEVIFKNQTSKGEQK